MNDDDKLKLFKLKVDQLLFLRVTKLKKIDDISQFFRNGFFIGEMMIC